MSADKTKKQLRKQRLIVAAVIFLVIGLIYFIYWFAVLRHHQETNDAYVVGNQVQVMAQVTGNVALIHFDNTDLVHAGDVLVTLDKTDAELAFERAKTALANSVRQTHQLIINSKQLSANIAAKETILKQAEADLKRREVLGSTNAIGREELQHARDAVDSAQANLDVATQQYEGNQALVLDTSLDSQPAVLQTSSQLRDAWLALKRTEIISPITGYVSQRNIQVGGRVSSGMSLMVVVPAEQLWVDANFKETQLANIRIGQSAVVVSDLYGDDVVYQGKVVGLDMGTGSAFSLLPAQNATGNWIKVVQRLPVRIELEPQQLVKYPLRIGLSMDVTVKTDDKTGAVLASAQRTDIPYQTSVLTYDFAEVDQLIAEIIQSNIFKLE